MTDPARRSVERRLAEAEGHTRRSRSDDATGSPVITKNDANAKSPDIATDIAPDDAPDESCRTDRNATPKETRTVEVRLVSNDSNDTAHCGLGVFSTSPRMDPGDVFGSPDGEFASASVPAKSNRSSRCSFCHRALSVAPTPCRTCSVSSYCDEACRDEDVAHAKFECGIETSGCWWSVLPSETAWRWCLAANARRKRVDARPPAVGGFRRGRTRAARRDRGGGESLRDTTARTPRGGVEPGRRPGSDVRGARERVRGEVAVARRNLFFQPRSAKRRDFPPRESARRARDNVTEAHPKPRAVPRRVVRSERGSRDGGARDVSGDVAAEPLVRSERARRARSFAGARADPRGSKVRTSPYFSQPVVRATTRARGGAAQTRAPRVMRAGGRVRTETSAARAAAFVARVHLRVRGCLCDDGPSRRRGARASPPSTTTTWPAEASSWTMRARRSRRRGHRFRAERPPEATQPSESCARERTREETGRWQKETPLVRERKLSPRRSTRVRSGDAFASVRVPRARSRSRRTRCVERERGASRARGITGTRRGTR